MPLHRTLRRISHTSVVHFRPTHTCPAIRIVPILELQILCTEPLRFGEDFGWFGASPLRLCCFLNWTRPFQHVVLDLKWPLGARTRRSKVKGILRPLPLYLAALETQICDRVGPHRPGHRVVAAVLVLHLARGRM